MKAPITCDKAAEVCDKAQYNEAGLWQKLLMKLHHGICKVCRGYSLRNGKLTRAMKSAKIETIPTEKKEAMKVQILEEMDH